MKTVVGTALCVFLVAAGLQVTGIAEPPGSEVEATPAPAAPEQWNVWGETEIDGVTVTLRPVACRGEAAENQLCVEVRAVNPTALLKHIRTNANLMAENSAPMARVGPVPELVESQPVILQVAAESEAVRTLVFTLPETLPFSLSLAIGEVDEWGGGVTVASVATMDPGEWGEMLWIE